MPYTRRLRFLLLLHRRARLAAAALASSLLLVFAISDAADAQRRRPEVRRASRPAALVGSRASVEKMYSFARRNGMPFYLTPATVAAAVARGRLVPLGGDSTYELTRGVGAPYATREARDFVSKFAPQYLHACGMPLTVTSAARPTSRQPRNSVQHSVHPTGIAVDLRRPYAGPCLDWLRKSLATLEARGIIEATEERRPVHIHLAVLVPPGQPVRLPSLIAGVPKAPRVVDPFESLGVTTLAQDSPASSGTFRFASMTPMDLFVPAPRLAVSPRSLLFPQVVAAAPRRVEYVSAGDVSVTPAEGAPVRTAGASAAPRHGATYRVRQGDTLWEIAQRAGVSVEALRKANGRSARAALKPGTVLRLPDRSR